MAASRRSISTHPDRRACLERGLIWGLGIVIALLSLWAKTRQLDLRPLHGDEAVQARILADLFAGNYHYDPDEFHGPLLHNLAAPLAAARGETRWESLSIIPLRATAALATALLCLTPLLLRRWLTNPGALAAALLLAVDPMLFYFGRDYIAEPVFVACLGLFTAAAARAVLQRSRGWAIAASVALAAAWATKETWVLHAAAAALAATIPAAFFARRWLAALPSTALAPRPLLLRLALPLAAAFVITWAVLFSQAGTSFSGLGDSLRSYLIYLARSGGEGHEKPFGYYAQTLFLDPLHSPKPARLNWAEYLQLLWTNPQRLRPWQSELPLLLLAVAGLGTCLWPFRRRQPQPQSVAQPLANAAPVPISPGPARPHPGLILWLFASAVFLLLAYSALRYKTIWSVLGVPALLALPAGVGLAALVQLPWRWLQLSAPLPRVVGLLTAVPAAAALMALGFHHRAQILWQNFEIDHSVSPANPWVYSQAPSALLHLPRRLETVLAQPAAHPVSDPSKPPRVIAISQSGIWPLPWYLRQTAYGVIAHPEQLAALGDRDRLRGDVAAFIVGPENAAAATPILENLGYRPDLLVQNYATSWVRLWLRDDLLPVPRPDSPQP